MWQTKKTTASAGKKRASGKKGALSWQPRRDDNRGKLIGVIAVVGIIAILAGYFLQASGVFSLHTDAEAVEGSTVRINEIMAQNMSTLVTETGDVPDWVEIANTGSEDVNLNHYGLMLKSNINNMFTFPDYTLKSGECLLVYCKGAGDANRADFSAPFKIEASGGDTLILMNASGKAVDAVELPELGADEAYARQDDGSWLVSQPTPGEDNSAVAAMSVQGGVEVVADSITLSEISSGNTLYFADENGEVHDYVEVHNTSSRDINLKGWYLSDSSDKLKRWSFPDVILPAGGYLAVHCSGYDRSTDAAHLHTDFKLSSDGESVYLSRPDGRTVSAVDTPALAADQAWSLVNGEWSANLAPTPGGANTEDMAAHVNLLTFGDKSASLRINEIMASPSEEEYDWVEIYNAGSQTLDLSGYGLSDSSDKPRKWQFPQGTSIQPGQYLGVFLSGTDESDVNGYLNADFALASEGGYTVTLSDPSGNVLDAAYIGQQYGGISYGRTDGSSGYYLFENETPIAANSTSGYRGRAVQAEASVQGGLYNSGESFLVELSAPAGSRIYYTLDCADPDEGSMLYTGPIAVSGTTILRSRVYQDGSMPSLIDTQSYLYDVSNPEGVYVISLVSDPDNLYSNDRGIMVKGPNAWAEYPYGKTNAGANFWMDWEREAHVEIFETDGDTAISQGCGIKLHGQYSRASDVKAFKVIARNEYGSNRFEYPIFSNRDYEEYQSFVLRASGQDYDKTFMRDSVLTSLAKDTSLLYQETEIGVCYLNGEYYSLFNLRERMSKHAICQFEDWVGLEDTLDIIKANDIEMQGSNDTFETMLAWLKKNDVTTQAAYDYIDSQIDIQNYIEYMTMEIFVGNGDTLNVKRYRSSATDGKWRWILFDLDWGFYVDTNSIARWLDPDGMGTGKYTDTTLFIACMRNPIFYEKFMTYFGEQMATTFTSENVMKVFQERYELIDAYLVDYHSKWNISEKQVNQEMSRLFGYIETRPQKLLGYFQEKLKLDDSEMEKYFGAAIDKIEEYAAGKAGE